MPSPAPYDPLQEHRRAMAARLAARARGDRRVRAVTGAAIAAGVLATGAVAVLASGTPTGSGSGSGSASRTEAVRETALATRRARAADREETAWEQRVSREALAAMEREREEESLAGSGAVAPAVTPQVQAPLPASVPPVVVSGGS